MWGALFCSLTTCFFFLGAVFTPGFLGGEKPPFTPPFGGEGSIPLPPAHADRARAPRKFNEGEGKGERAPQNRKTRLFPGALGRVHLKQGGKDQVFRAWKSGQGRRKRN
eukprot:FR737746.1.p2 GENE.FR737746.1~~FR737746.1.p2  ORF type:complete len:109 (-),score=30.87 FR737746.1:912-1238(-)